MMNSWTIRQRILLSFLGILGMLALMAALSFSYLREIRDNAQTIKNDSAAGALASADLKGQLLEDYSLLQQHLLADDKTAMAGIETKLAALRTTQQQRSLEYEKTVFVPLDRTLHDAFKAAIVPYWAAQDRVIKLSNMQKGAPLRAFVASELDPDYSKAKAAISAVVERNEKYTFATIAQIEASVERATYTVMAGLALIFLLSCFAGYFLMRAISEPLQRLVGALDVMRQGDFTSRMVAERRDEFGVAADGFNRMSDELAALVGQVQK